MLTSSVKFSFLFILVLAVGALCRGQGRGHCCKDRLNRFRGKYIDEEFRHKQWKSNKFGRFGDSYPKNQYEYFKERDALIQAELEFEYRDWNPTEDERVVDQYLGYLKWKEAEITRSYGMTPARPIQDTYKFISSSELFLALKGLPKGGILHSHEDHQLGKEILFDIIWKSPDFDNLYIVDPKAPKNAWLMDFFVNPPQTDMWIKVKDSGITKEDVIKMNSLIGVMTKDANANPTDASLRWQLINPLWGRASGQLISNYEIKKQYLRAMFEHGMSEGVTYFESRRSMGSKSGLYVLDRSGQYEQTNGKKYLDPTQGLECELAMNVSAQFMAENPSFIGHKRISYGSRSMEPAVLNQVINATLKLHKKYPNHVVGFDTVGEEDAGYSTIHFIDNYLALHNDGKSEIPLFLHSMETSWPEDLMPNKLENDLVSPMANGYDAILLGAKRVGHGKGFSKKPFLIRLLKERKIAVEICATSNQILGMDVDLRNHFGQIFLKDGVPIVLAPDDPGTFGYDNFTVDWYTAYLGWGLNLGDLKQIAANSIIYSGMTEAEKVDAIIQKWLPGWNKYIQDMKSIACARDYASEAQAEKRNAKFTQLFPNIGVPGTNVHIYGRNFEKAICKTPKCKFGSGRVVDAMYDSNQHITCSAPYGENGNVQLQVALNGEDFEDTGLKFTYADISTLM